MISLKSVKLFCNEDFNLIENYDKAINDVTKTWDCHHRKETDEGLSKKQLIELGLYYKRPACELIFLTSDEHMRLHHSGIQLSEEHKKNLSKARKGRQFNKEWKQKLSEIRKGKKRIVKDGKGAYCKPEELEYYLINGWQLLRYNKKKEQH